jgi:predicted HNH restriction endonuclease
MQKHTKIYLDHHGLTGQEFIPCVCGAGAVDIHHIKPKGIGGDRDADRIDNLVALCRACHEAAHAGKLNLERGEA